MGEDKEQKEEEAKKKTEGEAKKRAAEEAKQPHWEYDPDGSGTWMPFKDDCQSYIESKYQLFAGGTIAAKRITTDTSDDNDCKLKLSIDFSSMSARVAGGTHVSQSCFVPGEQRSIRRGDKADEEDKKKTEEEAKKKAAEEAKQPLWEYDPDGSGT